VQDDGISAQLLFQLTQRMHPLWQLHDRIIFSLIKGIDADMVPVRTKSVRSLTELLCDTDVGTSIQSKILDAISNRLSDASPAVREACIEAISKYALGQGDEEILLRHCSRLAARIMDVKVSVRKRVIKTFKDIFSTCLFKPIDALLEDMLRKLLLRLNDEETSIRDLAFKTLAEILMPADDKQFEWEKMSSELQPTLKRKLLLLSRSLMCNHTIGSLYFQFLEKVTVKGSKYHATGKSFVNTLMAYIIFLSEKQDKTNIDATLYLLSQIAKVFPSDMIRHVSTLQTMIQLTSTDPIDINIFQNCIFIIKESINHSDALDIKLMHALQNDLQGMLTKGSQPVLYSSHSRFLNLPSLVSVPLSNIKPKKLKNLYIFFLNVFHFS
jgi:hypothetical protein